MHAIAKPSLLLLLPPLAVLGLAGGCQSRAPAPPLVAAGSGSAPARDERSPGPPPGEEARAIDAIKRADYAAAHQILGRLLFAEHLAQARALLAENQPEDALLKTEAALALFPKDPEGRLLDARARLLFAEKGAAEGRPFVREAFEDALRAYRDAGDSAAALFGASRAAFLLGRNDEALELARAGMQRLDQRDVGLDRLPQRIYAEAAYAAYVERRAFDAQGDGAAAEGPSKEELAQRFLETEAALTSLLGRAAADPWAHKALAHVYDLEGRLADARDAVMRGLDHVPNDEDMLGKLKLYALAAGGSEGVLQAMLEFQARHPDMPGGYWYEALERFELALAALQQSTPQPGEFRAAEKSFRRCRELEPAYDQNCRGYELMCRDAVGWCLFQARDIAGAKDAFLSMEELQDRGLEWKIEGRLGSGVDGLAFCADVYHREESWLEAGEIFDYLRRYVPSELVYANNAGLDLRDAAVALEALGQRLCRASRGEVASPEIVATLREAAGVPAAVTAGSPEERELLRAAADQHIARAVEIMKKSADAYLAAAELAPEDVRIVNDTALVFVYYLHTNLDRAERMLQKCVELGEKQLADTTLAEDARWELENAWGDAHQNLGVLYARHHGDKARAARWFEKSAEIGPEPREAVEDFWLPYVRGAPVDPTLEAQLVTETWAKPCK